MSAESSALLARLTTTAEAVEGLRDLFAAGEPFDVVARRVADAAVAAIPHADVVSITVLAWPGVHTAACTDERALALDDQQYASGQGPCLDAALTRTPLRAIIDQEHRRWPEFVEAAHDAGIRASLSIPLVIAGADGEQELAGSLNMYSRTTTSFDEFDTELVRLYSAAAGQAISNAGRWHNARGTVAQLEKALLSRADIDMAKGALIAIHGCDPAGAFDRLRRESQRRNTKVRVIAREMLLQMQEQS
jgi:hypothetical protein